MARWQVDYGTMPRFFKTTVAKCKTELVSDKLRSKNQSIILTCQKQLKIITFQIGSVSGMKAFRMDLIVLISSDQNIRFTQPSKSKVLSCQFPQLRLYSQHQAQSSSHNTQSVNGFWKRAIAIQTNLPILSIL